MLSTKVVFFTCSYSTVLEARLFIIPVQYSNVCEPNWTRVVLVLINEYNPSRGSLDSEIVLVQTLYKKSRPFFQVISISVLLPTEKHGGDMYKIYLCFQRSQISEKN